MSKRKYKPKPEPAAPPDARTGEAAERALCNVCGTSVLESEMHTYLDLETGTAKRRCGECTKAARGPDSAPIQASTEKAALRSESDNKAVKSSEEAAPRREEGDESHPIEEAARSLDAATPPGPDVPRPPPGPAAHTITQRMQELTTRAEKAETVLGQMVRYICALSRWQPPPGSTKKPTHLDATAVLDRIFREHTEMRDRSLSTGGQPTMLVPVGGVESPGQFVRVPVATVAAAAASLDDPKAAPAEARFDDPPPTPRVDAAHVERPYADPMQDPRVLAELNEALVQAGELRDLLHEERDARATTSLALRTSLSRVRDLEHLLGLEAEFTTQPLPGVISGWMQELAETAVLALPDALLSEGQLTAFVSATLATAFTARTVETQRILDELGASRPWGTPLFALEKAVRQVFLTLARTPDKPYDDKCSALEEAWLDINATAALAQKAVLDERGRLRGLAEAEVVATTLARRGPKGRVFEVRRAKDAPAERGMPEALTIETESAEPETEEW